MSDAAKAVWVGIGFLLVVFVALLLGGWIVMLLWNHALITIVAACGGTIGKLGFWTAFGLNLILFVLKPTPSYTKPDKS